MFGLKKKGFRYMTRKNKKTKNPKVGSLVYDKDHEDWGVIVKIEKDKDDVIQYTIQFVDDRETIVMADIHDSEYQECYE
jgi:hypothetical protein